MLPYMTQFVLFPLYSAETPTYYFVGVEGKNFNNDPVVLKWEEYGKTKIMSIPPHGTSHTDIYLVNITSQKEVTFKAYSLISNAPMLVNGNKSVTVAPSKFRTKALVIVGREGTLFQT